MSYPLAFIIGNLAIQWLLIALFGSVYWVPNLALISVVLAVWVWPRSWLWIGLFPGIANMCWSLNDAPMILIAFFMAALAVRTISQVLDLGELRTQVVLVIAGQLIWMVLNIWLADAWSITLIIPASVYFALTLLALSPSRGFLLRTCPGLHHLAFEQKISTG